MKRRFSSHSEHEREVVQRISNKQQADTPRTYTKEMLQRVEAITKKYADGSS